MRWKPTNFPSAYRALVEGKTVRVCLPDSCERWQYYKTSEPCLQTSTDIEQWFSSADIYWREMAHGKWEVGVEDVGD